MTCNRIHCEFFIAIRTFNILHPQVTLSELWRIQRMVIRNCSIGTLDHRNFFLIWFNIVDIFIAIWFVLCLLSWISLILISEDWLFTGSTNGLILTRLFRTHLLTAHRMKLLWLLIRNWFVNILFLLHPLTPCDMQIIIGSVDNLSAKWTLLSTLHKTYYNMSERKYSSLFAIVFRILVSEYYFSLISWNHIPNNPFSLAH